MSVNMAMETYQFLVLLKSVFLKIFPPKCNKWVYTLQENKQAIPTSCDLYAF